MSNVIEFLLIVGKLKTEKRTGWINNKVKFPESISDHMYRMAVMGFLIDDPSINRDRCIKLGLVHDMAEAVVGDITPDQGISKKDKHDMELKAMTEITSTLGGTIGQEFFELYQEYEQQETVEAQLVKDFDKLEMIVQAFEYEQAQELQLDTFYETTRNSFRHPKVKLWVEELYKKRKSLQHITEKKTDENKN